MYNDVTMNIRQSVKPYMAYRSNKIGDAATGFAGQLDINGFPYEAKNVHFDEAKNYLAKISYVQINYTDEKTVAKLQLRLLDLSGEFDFFPGAAADGKQYADGTVAFKFDRVYVVPTLYLNDKTVRTKVLVENPVVEYKGHEPSYLSNAAKDQFTGQFVEYFVQKLAEATSRNIQSSIM